MADAALFFCYTCLGTRRRGAVHRLLSIGAPIATGQSLLTVENGRTIIAGRELRGQLSLFRFIVLGTLAKFELCLDLSIMTDLCFADRKALTPRKVAKTWEQTTIVAS